MKKICLFLSLLLLLFSCADKEEEQLVDILIDLERTDYPGERVSAATVDNIREAVATYRNLVDDEVRGTQELALLYKRVARHYMDLGALNQQIATLALPPQNEPGDVYYHKLLAIKSLDKTLYGKAFESLQKALRIDSRNPILYYLSAVSAGWIAKSYLGAEGQRQRSEWLEQAENHYREAIALKPGYSDALYGLAVLLSFEYQGRLDEALDCVEQVLARESRNLEALFLQARILAAGAAYTRAAVVYDRILSIVDSGEAAEKARELKAQLEDTLYATE